MTPCDVVAVDTETCLIAPGLQAPPLVCVAFSTGHLVHWTQAEDVLVALLESDLIIVGHNVAFDMAVIGAQFPRLLPLIFAAYEADRVEDTQIRQKLLDIAGGVYRGYTRTDGQTVKINYHLDDLAQRHLGLTLDKDTWRLRYGELRDTPVEQWPEGARAYALTDARVTLDVWRAQEPNRQWLEDQHRQVRAAFWLRLMQCWGLRTDPAAVREFERRAYMDYRRLAQELEAAGLKRPDRVLKSGKNKGKVVEGARDTKAAAARMTAAFKGAPPRTDCGGVALDDASCRASGDPLLVAYAEFSSIKKVLSTDVPLLKSGTVTPIHARFEELLETGRTSSSPNVQNLPRRPGVRECFVPRPGFVYAAADYTGLELRTFAQACMALLGHSRLAEVLNAGGDPHLEIAAAILGCSYEEAEARYKAGDDDADNARQTGKVANFGFPGGLGPASFVHFAALQYGVKLTEEQARGLKELWKSRWPEAAQYLQLVGQLVDVEFPQVEQLYSRRFRGGVSYTEACNTFFQGLGADAAKAAGWLIARACYVDQSSILYGSRLVNFIHDEFILEVPEDIGHECAHELARLMVEGAAPWLPDVRPMAEPVLMRRWSKKAKQVWKEGRLVPWE